MTRVLREMPELLRIRERFVEMHHDRHDRLEELLEATRRDVDAEAALLETRRILHKIAGTAGTLGFAALGTSAREVEYLIDTHLDGCGFQPDQGVAVINPATAKEERAGIIAALDVLLDDSLRVCVPDI